MRLDQMARVLRSKNAGPLKITFDLMFEEAAHYELVRNNISKLRVEAAGRLGVPENKLQVIDYPPAKAIKIVMHRDKMAGDPGDRDAFGAQQHTPLMEIDL